MVDIKGASKIGSFLWGQEREGILTSGEKLSFAVNVAMSQVNRFFNFKRTNRAFVDPDKLRLPDTKSVISSLEWLTETSPDWLVNHCLRTWCWARIFSINEFLDVDEEALAVSCILHDIALLDSANESCPCCFAVKGARSVGEFLSGHDWDEKRILSVANSISMHMNPAVHIFEGVEAYLLNAGAALDVIGVRSDEVDLTSKENVLKLYSRAGFKHNFKNAMYSQHKISHGSRVDVLWRLGFGCAIDKSSLDDG
jgi:hypothetical protein